MSIKVGNRIFIDDEITDGKVNKIAKFSVEFDKIEVIFEDLVTGAQKRMQFTRVLSLSCIAEVWYDAHDAMVNEWDADMDIMAYRTLIGFDYTKEGNTYHYCMKIDDYEIVIKSLHYITLTDI